MQKYLERERERERERARARTNVLIIYSYIKKEKIDEREIFQLLWYYTRCYGVCI